MPTPVQMYYNAAQLVNALYMNKTVHARLLQYVGQVFILELVVRTAFNAMQRERFST